MKNKTLVLLVVPPKPPEPGAARNPVKLDSAAGFAVLGAAAVENTGKTAVHGGDVGTSYGREITGFPPGTVAMPHITRAADGAAQQAHKDLGTAYDAAAAMPFTHDLSGQDLGGLTLLPGVYRFSAGATLNGTLTLNNQGDPDAKFLFQIGTTLTTGRDSSVILINGGPGVEVKSAVTWLVGTSATIGADSAFEGNILAREDIMINTDASIRDGSALSEYGDVTLDSNRITNDGQPPK